MPELPTLDTIKEISSGDKKFEKRLVSIIKRELPLEIEQYNKDFEADSLKKVADIVHKLNHKINIFGLGEGSRKAVDFENELRSGSSEMKNEFDAILETMSRFLNTL
ncbi:hypothetical protein JM83_0409 [Gillisia sp. Hel_I_86]|uniref:Hpt domain-containing protein n=1 Tax=Gillisia sp. Hel_I_86 TaxID=1249981 RepID=UPI00119C7F39|nr:Hpt domain-containing protein [Gillisia sp. Hel_I_86]TVZ25490.1 hypothetical protein JM83_0409 [Gillisia sp. Hel_I_86]